MKIAFLLYPGFTALDVVGPFDVLSRLPASESTFVGVRRGPVRNDNDRLALVADATLDELTDPDLVVVPGGTAGTRRAARDEQILDWLRRVHESSQFTTSVCTGALILAAAGLLGDGSATTHWAARAELEKLGVPYEAKRWVRHGKVVTAAGVSAGIDLALYLVGEIASDTVGKAIQLGLEYDPQPPFDSGSVEKADRATLAVVDSVFT